MTATKAGTGGEEHNRYRERRDECLRLLTPPRCSVRQLESERGLLSMGGETYAATRLRSCPPLALPLNQRLDVR